MFLVGGTSRDATIDCICLMFVFHEAKNEIELIQMGVLKEYQGAKFGSFLLGHIIYEAFNRNVERIWVHTCSLDHKHALDNYLSKGFKIFKEETIDFTF